MLQSKSIIDLDLRIFHQNTQNQFNFLVLYVTKFRQISRYAFLKMMERSTLREKKKKRDVSLKTILSFETT